MKVLNIAAGKMSYPKDSIDKYFVVNLDRMYFRHTPTEVIEERYREWNNINNNESVTFHCKEDIFEFLERTQMLFDIVLIYRFLEHVSFTELLYFIYLVSTVVKKGALIDIIVPNYKTLANMILNENIKDSNFEKNNILLTTELLNEKSDPHSSIWTPERAKYYWEFENRFKVNNSLIDPNYKYDGRNIYLRFNATRK